MALTSSTSSQHANELGNLQMPQTPQPLTNRWLCTVGAAPLLSMYMQDLGSQELLTLNMCVTLVGSMSLSCI